jgi:transcriptional regulator of aromatic amino acid metabolism
MEFSIHGRLIVDDCKGHQDMILKLFKLLGDGSIRFVGETKEIKDK